MSYRKNQGRYARMTAFWVVALLLGYGCFRGGGLADVVGGWLSEDRVLIDNFPLVSQLRVSTLIAAGVLVAALFVTARILNGPKIADLLIDTESEMHKVTWPNWGEVAQGTMAVTAMVLVLFFFLTGVDLLFARVMTMLIPGASG
ncbi:MAG: preprotein translocase subunit SecE [Planctomycetes bacterium]|nr:preprotein translocase subunit SecE [Planctomycetota bacterium]